MSSQLWMFYSGVQSRFCKAWASIALPFESWLRLATIMFWPCSHFEVALGDMITARWSDRPTLGSTTGRSYQSIKISIDFVQDSDLSSRLVDNLFQWIAGECCVTQPVEVAKHDNTSMWMLLWRSAMRATQTAWNSLSHLEEATLHRGLFKRLRALVVVCFSDCSDGGGSVGPVPWVALS